MIERHRLDAVLKRAKAKTPETAIRRLSRNLLRESGVTKPPFKPEQLGRSINMRIEKTNLVDCDARLLPAPGGYLAEVCQSHSVERQNFSLCHEIAHTFFEPLDFNYPSQIVNCSVSPINAKNDEEKLCNMASAEMLMPRKIFSEYVQDADPSMTSIRSISELFGTSTQTVITRILELDLWELVFVCLNPINAKYTGLGFEISWWKSSESAFRGYLNSDEVVYCLQSMAKELKPTDESGILETFTTGRDTNGKLLIRPLGKTFEVSSYKVYQRKTPSVFSLILKDSY